MWALLLLCFTSGCGSSATVVNPFTTVPAVLIGGYEKIHKRKVWKEFAQEGDVYAQWELANSYCCSGLEGKRNYPMALHWFCEAAENGHAEAQTKIADFYLHKASLGSLNIIESKVDAYVWYSLAARRVYGPAIDARLALIDTMSDAELDAAEAKFQAYDELSCKSMIDYNKRSGLQHVSVDGPLLAQN